MRGVRWTPIWQVMLLWKNISTDVVLRGALRDIPRERILGMLSRVRREMDVRCLRGAKYAVQTVLALCLMVNYAACILRSGRIGIGSNLLRRKEENAP
jgi:hypothetical protein